MSLGKEAEDKILKPLQKAADAFSKLREKFTSFQLQLITVSSATFTIYLALGRETTSNITKWGFVFLAPSLILGLLSIFFRMSGELFKPWYIIFDVEKFIRKHQDPEINGLLSSIGITEPVFYNEKLDPEILEGREKSSAKSTREFLTSGVISISDILGILQLLAILISAIFLLVGLILTPVMIHEIVL